MKYLIVGLGNEGAQYENSRHNIGFKVIDAMAEESSLSFKLEKHAHTCTYKIKGRTFILVKPTTFVNLSGKAVNYWMQKERISLENILIVLDDLAIPFGKLRLRQKGNDGGHNGLKNIDEVLGTNNYARLRIGIGASFAQGTQIDYVLGDWSEDESKELPSKIGIAVKMIESFGTAGVQRTMSDFNNS
ncbi:MAG: aminoacyl-tRNA hydrolase [Bacteroidetes bacterium]|nr:MAG: aminoacyl-tRNA hydrolase [Bacteroidota bacterium]